MKILGIVDNRPRKKLLKFCSRFLLLFFLIHFIMVYITKKQSKFLNRFYHHLLHSGQKAASINQLGQSNEYSFSYNGMKVGLY